MKYTSKTTILAVLLCLAYACQKSADTSKGQFSQVQISMTDAPYDAQQVNIDLREVRLKYKDEDSWTSLQTHAGIYNLLDFQNGLDTLIATGIVPVNTNLQEMRLILGSDNSIMIDSMLYPLTIPSGSDSGLKVKLIKKISRSIEAILIDFDASLSVIKTGNGEFKLKPVIKLK